MAESFQDKRRKELGLSGSSQESDFQRNRQMDLGMIPDTRPKPTFTTPATAFNKPGKELDGFGYLANQIRDFNAAHPAEEKQPSYRERVMERVNKFPQILRPLAVPIAAIEETPFSRAIRQQTAPENHVGEKPVGGLAGFAASVAIPLTTPGAGLGGGSLYKQAGKVVQRYAPKLEDTFIGRVGSEAIKGGSTGAVLGPGNTLALNPEASNKELLASAGFGAGFGIGLGGLSPYIGSAAKKIFSGGGKVTVPAARSEPLALPAPRERGNLNGVETPEVIYGSGKVEPPGLPEPDLAPPTTARVEKQPGLNEVLERIKPIVDERMTPPYENPDELARWIQKTMDLDDLSLNEIRKMSYGDMHQLAEDLRKDINVYDTAVNVSNEMGFDLPKLLNPKEIDPNLVQRARARQESRDLYGVKSPVKSMSDRYPQGGVVSPVAEPVERVGRVPGLSPMRQNPVAEVVPPSSRISRPRVDVTPAENITPIQPRIKPEAPYVDDGSLSFLDMADDMEKKGYFSDLPSMPEGFREEPYARPAAGDDIADNSFADEVAPRVRDRLSSFADDVIAKAKSELAKNRNRLSSNPVDEYGQYAKLLSGYMLKGAVKLADATEILVREFGESIRPHIKEIFKQAKQQYGMIKQQIEGEELGLTGFEGQEMKDISSLNLNTTDVYNNFRKVFGPKLFPAVKKAVLDPFDASKGAFAQEQKNLYEDLYENIVKKYGMKKGSKLSAAVQKYGEGTMTLDDIKAEFPDRYQHIIDADHWFRAKYDDLIDKANVSIAKIYPNNPDKLVPRRKDYYRHFKEMSLLHDIQSLFDTSGSISPQLAGLSPHMQPRSKWASFKQKRGLGEFKNDAVGGFLDYVPAASYAIHIDPHISVFRNLAKRLADDTEQTKNLNNFIRYLNNFANDLAGKTSPFDRWVEEASIFKGGGGRAALGLVTKFSNRVKKNVILGNVRSTLSQMANIPLGISQGGIDAPKGMARTIVSAFEPNPAMNKSDFLAERYVDSEAAKFARWWEKPEKTAGAMMRIADRVGTSFIWNTMHAKAIRKGIANPIKFADDETRRLVAGRGVGEIPLAFKSKLGGIVAPFQIEVNNLWRIMKRNVDERQFGALMTLFITNWLLNKGMKEVTGNGVVFDPIDAINMAITDEDATPLERGGRLAGEVISNLPLGQMLTLLYKENGMNIGGVDLPSRAKLFGDKDPTRFGTGLVLAGGVNDPIFKLILPFGGNQLKKTIQGADALVRGGSYTENVLTTGPEIEEKKLKYPVASSPINAAKTLTFGPYASNEGREYASEDQRPLSEKQTKIYNNSNNPQAYLDAIKRLRNAK